MGLRVFFVKAECVFTHSLCAHSLGNTNTATSDAIIIIQLITIHQIPPESNFSERFLTSLKLKGIGGGGLQFSCKNLKKGLKTQEVGRGQEGGRTNNRSERVRRKVISEGRGKQQEGAA